MTRGATSPSESPPTPVVDTRPPVRARPCCWVAASTAPTVSAARISPSPRRLAGRTLAGRAAPSAALAHGGAAHLAIRPEDIEVAPHNLPRRETNWLPGVIESLSFVGDRYEARVALGGEYRVALFIPRGREWRDGERLQLGFPPERVSVWPA